MDIKNMNIWRDESKARQPMYIPEKRCHADPTADRALGNIIRDEKKKRRKAKQKSAPRTRVWRAEWEEKREGKRSGTKV